MAPSRCITPCDSTDGLAEQGARYISCYRSTLLTLLPVRWQLDELHAAIAPLQRDNFDLDLAQILPKADATQFSLRWQVFNHKLDRFATEMYASLACAGACAATWLSNGSGWARRYLNNFKAAFYFIKTAEHDVLALQQLAAEAASNVHLTLDCSRPPAPPKAVKERIVLLGGVLLSLAAVTLRTRRESWD